MEPYLAALIGALGVIAGGSLAFASRWLIDRPAQRGDFLLKELEFYTGEYRRLRSELADAIRQMAQERAKHLEELTAAKSQHTIELAERDATIAALSVRVSELERQTMTPQQRSADLRRAQKLLDKGDLVAEGGE